MSIPANAPFFARSTIRGTSAWQCGHQCATNNTTCGLEVGAMVTDDPSNETPWRVGMVSPIAVSTPPETYCGSGAPSTVTAPVSCCVAFAESPPNDNASAAATPMTSALAPRIHHVRFRPGAGAGLL